MRHQVQCCCQSDLQNCSHLPLSNPFRRVLKDKTWLFWLGDELDDDIWQGYGSSSSKHHSQWHERPLWKGDEWGALAHCIIQDNGFDIYYDASRRDGWPAWSPDLQGWQCFPNKGGFWVRQAVAFLFFWALLDKMTQSHVHVRIQSAITPSNQQRAVLKPCGEQSELFPSSISHSHVKGGGRFPQRSWAHFEHIIVLLFPLQPHYRTIWLQGGNKGRRRNISSSVDEVDAGPRAGLLPLSCLTRVWLQGCSGKVQLYKNTVCVHSRWNCMSHTFGHRGGEA